MASINEPRPGDENKSKSQLIDELNQLRHRLFLLEGSEAKCRRTEHALTDSEEKFRRIVQTAEEGIWMIGKDDRVAFANFRMADMLGYAVDELIGKYPYDFMEGPYVEIAVTNLRRRRFGVKECFTHKLRRKDGTGLWVLVSSAPLYKEGQYDGHIEMVTNISNLKEAEEELLDAKVQAELYVDLMGHDINNMNQIALGFLEIARDIMESEGKLEKDKIFLLEKAMDSMKNCTRLIDNVRKLQREKKGLYMQETLDIGEILEEIAMQYKHMPGRSVRIDYEAGRGFLVNANALLRDVFINIVGNAIKHSTGPLTVRIMVEKVHDAGRPFYKVTIEDDGPGIPGPLKRTLLNRLSLDNTKATGKGFGLCLTKMLVDDYQGKFWVEDRVQDDYKKGSRFVIMLPTAFA